MIVLMDDPRSRVLDEAYVQPANVLVPRDLEHLLQLLTEDTQNRQLANRIVQQLRPFCGRSISARQYGELIAKARDLHLDFPARD